MNIDMSTATGKALSNPIIWRISFQESFKDSVQEAVNRAEGFPPNQETLFAMQQIFAPIQPMLLLPATISCAFGELHLIYQNRSVVRFKQVSIIVLPVEPAELHLYWKYSEQKSQSKILEVTGMGVTDSLTWLHRP